MDGFQGRKERIGVTEGHEAEGSVGGFLELRRVGAMTGVYTSVQIPAEAVIIRLKGVRVHRPVKYSVQIDEAVHLDETGLVDANINHACFPNAFVDTSDPFGPSIRALIRIPGGSEVTIDYCASEDELAEPFECRCGAEGCYGVVRGFSYLTPRQRSALKDTAAPYLVRKYRLV